MNFFLFQQIHKIEGHATHETQGRATHGTQGAAHGTQGMRVVDNRMDMMRVMR